MGTRDTTFEGFVNSATSLFLEKGFSSVLMSDISDAQGTTRRTLYRYFSCKEDLIYEIIIRLLNEWNADQVRVYEGLSGNGLIRLGDFLHALVDHVENRKAVLRLMGEFDFVFRDDLPYEPSLENKERFLKAAGLTERFMTEMLQTGLADGSIRSDTKIHMIVATISSVLWGTAQRVAVRENLMQEEFGFSGIKLLHFQIDLYLRALKA